MLPHCVHLTHWCTLWYVPHYVHLASLCAPCLTVCTLPHCVHPPCLKYSTTAAADHCRCSGRYQEERAEHSPQDAGTASLTLANAVHSPHNAVNTLILTNALSFPVLVVWLAVGFF